MQNQKPPKTLIKDSIRLSRACRSRTAIAAGFLLASAAANASIIFQADFKGPGSGTGGTNDLVTVGGTGAIVADGVHVKAFVTNANPFTPGGGNYLETQRLPVGGGGQYSPLLFTFASNSNSWQGWQGADIVDLGGNPNIALHAAFDAFFRVNTNSQLGVNDMFAIRFLQQFSWSDGGNGLSLRLNGQNNGSMIFQLQNAGFAGLTPQAIQNFTSSGGNVAYNPAYDVIDMNFTEGGKLLTNGVVYHVAVSLDTDTNGLTTAKVYLAPGTGALGPLNVQGSATFNLIATNLLNWGGNPTDQCFTNQSWNTGTGWAAGGPFVADYASIRSYNSAPATFTALPAPLKFLSEVQSGGQITLTWSGGGRLQWAPSLQGPWTFITPAPASPYSEPLGPGARFYRLLAQ